MSVPSEGAGLCRSRRDSLGLYDRIVRNALSTGSADLPLVGKRVHALAGAFRVDAALALVHGNTSRMREDDAGGLLRDDDTDHLVD